MTPAHIRNSLHSNGIHHGYKKKPFHSNLKGVTYDFVHGHKVSCATVPHVAHALECSVEVLDQVYSSTSVKNHIALIADTYASLLGIGSQ